MGSKISARIDRLVDKPDMQVKAYASVSIGDTFAVHGLRVVDSEKGLFVAMPSSSYQDKDGNTQYKDIFHAVTKPGRDAVQTVVLNAYHAELQQRQSASMEVSEAPAEAEPEPDPVMECF